MCSENPKPTLMNWLYKHVRKHDQPKSSTTRSIQRKGTWNKNEYYKENTKIKYKYNIVNKLLQPPSNTLWSNLDLDNNGIYGGLKFYCHPLGTRWQMQLHSYITLTPLGNKIQITVIYQCTSACCAFLRNIWMTSINKLTVYKSQGCGDVTQYSCSI